MPGQIQRVASPRNQWNHKLGGNWRKATNPQKPPLRGNCQGSRCSWLPLFLLQHHSDDFAVRLSLDIRHCPPVHVHRGRDARMTHQLLLHFEWRARGIQPRTIRVPEGVPPYLGPDPGSDRCLLQRLLLNLLLMVRPARPGVRE